MAWATLWYLYDTTLMTATIPSTTAENAMHTINQVEKPHSGYFWESALDGQNNYWFAWNNNIWLVDIYRYLSNGNTKIITIFCDSALFILEVYLSLEVSIQTPEKSVTSVINVLCVGWHILNRLLGHMSLWWCIYRKRASRTVVKETNKAKENKATTN